MTDPNDESKKPDVNAENNSIAVGGISAGGDISGNIHIGNVYQTPEDDLPLSSEEIENGLIRFAQYLPERAPVLQDQFSSIAKKLRATLGADQNSLSPALKTQREDGVNRMKLMCVEVTDISFRAMCLGQNPPPYDARPPFLGLFAFRPEDREFFFGREALVGKLVARIKAHPFLAVLGASGSGKSSLVMAGLVPALEAEMSYFTPSSAPLSQLITAKESASAKTIFVVDQFEELFTHPHDAAERADFIHALLELTKTNRVVLTMRADFWGEVAIYTDLKQAMQEHQELIAPMNVDELHAAMEKQAAVVGLRFDPTLSESILAEVKGEPGAMPLLQHALWELWNRRHGLWIKAEEYQAFGGVKQAIASTAEEAYASCSNLEQERVRDIFLRLTRLDESSEGRDTRRRVLIEELIPANSDSSVTIKLLDKLADARLIVKTDKDVEVAHEALIRHWSRLTNWLNEDRNNLILREGVSESARDWEDSKRDDSLLNHRGVRLELALAMSKLPRYQLNSIEQAYLNSCRALRNKELRERERRLRWTVAVSIGAAIIFLVLGGFGLVKSNEATAQAGTAQANANIALSAQANAETEKQNAENQADIAQVNELAALALTNKDENPDLALLLSVEAYNRLVDYQTLNSLFIAVRAKPQILGYLVGNGSVNSVSFSPDGKKLATRAFSGEVRLWDVETQSLLLSMSFGNPIGYPGNNCVRFSPAGDILATGGATGLVLLDASTDEPVIILNWPIGPVSSLSFSSNGKFLAIGRRDENTILLLDVDTRSLLATFHAPGDDKISSGIPSNTGAQVALSPNGKILAGSWNNSIAIWDIAVLSDIKTLSTFEMGDEVVTSVIFSPKAELLASGGFGGSVMLWDTQRFEKVGQTLKSTRGVVYDLAFSPDGKILASDGAGPDPQDKAIMLWDVASRSQIQALLGHSHAVLNVDFSPDGRMLASGSEDGNVILWNILPDDASEVPGYLPLGKVIRKAHVNTPNDTLGDIGIDDVEFSPDGNYLAIASTLDGVTIWDLNAHRIVRNYLPPRVERTDKVAFSPNSKLLALGTSQGSIILYDIATNVKHCDIANVYDGRINGLVFSPIDNSVLATSSFATIKIWDVKSCTQMNQFSTLNIDRKSQPYTASGNMVFSSDGNLLIKENAVWDLLTGELIGELPNCYGSVLSIDYAKNLIACDAILNQSSEDSHQNILLFDAKTRNSVGQPLIGHQFSISGIEFSQNEHIVAASSYDGTLRLWDLVTHHTIGEPISPNPIGVESIALSPDGKTLAIGSYDDSVILWDISPDLWRDRACKVVGRNFTRAEWAEYSPNKEYRPTCPQWPLEQIITPTATP